MKTSALLCCLLLIAGCTGGPDDVTVTPFEAGIWSGTFTKISATNPQQTITQTGVVTFKFAATTYAYEGEVQSPAGPGNPMGPFAIHDVGIFDRKDHGVTLFDQALERMVMWYPSLYLYGDFVYTLQGRTMTITQNFPGRTLTMVLTKQFSR